MVVQESVTEKAKDLLVANITNDILKQKVENFFGSHSEGLVGSGNPNSEDLAISFEEQISEIEMEIEEILNSNNPDQQRLRDLLDQKLSLELQR